MAAMFLLFSIASAGQSPPLPEGIASRDRDLIYGRKYGMSLTMDRFVPAKPNGKAVVWVVSGGWFSNPDAINAATAAPLCKAGYQVFAVCHGSQPRFTIPEILDDMHRSTRWIRANASRFQVDPGAIGVTGGSAGGHLSLMLGMVHRPGDAKAKDPVDRQPSGCQAVACFFPPTDFLNWTKPGEVMLGKPHLLKNLPPAFDFHTQDKLTGQFRLITDEKERERIGKEISPISHISAGSAPVYLVQGTSDLLVPQSQADTFMAALKEKGIAGELVIKRGAGHGWAGMDKDLEQFANWFDKHLAARR